MIKPLKDHILVKAEKEEEITKSGFYIPKENKTKADEGTIVAVGSTVDELKVGDHIIFQQYTPNEVVLEGQTYLFMTEIDVLGVFPKAKK